MSIKILITFFVILIIATPAYQICQQIIARRINYRNTYYEILCSEDNNWQFNCKGGESNLTITSNNVSTLDKSMFDIACKVTSISMTNVTLGKIIPGAFSKFSDLRYIDLSNNNISSILDGTFSNENAIQVLNISRNKIETINEHGLCGLDHMQYLILHHNRLEQFNYSYLKNDRLVKLDLSFNNISVVSNFKTDNFSVNSLDLSYNSIKNLSKDLIPNPKDLQYFNLSGNLIEQIPLKTFLDCHNLLLLNLSNNKFNNLQFGVFNNLDKLEILDLSNNKLVTNDLHTMLGLKSLNEFYFHDNEISEFDMTLFPANLRKISFYGNKFKFTCQQLSQIISNLHRKRLVILTGKEYDIANFNGIGCNSNSSVSTIDVSSTNSGNNTNFYQLDFLKSIKTFNERVDYLIKINERSANELKKIDEVNHNLQVISEAINEQKLKDKSDSMNDYFETKFKETNFYKFFKNFKAIEINTLNHNSSVKNNTAITERLVSSYLAPEEDSLLKSISVQFTVVLVMIVGFLIVMVIIRRNWILNQLRLGNTVQNLNSDRMNLTVATTASSIESLEMRDT